jgi:sugar phosphate isomerase/epimerase
MRTRRQSNSSDIEISRRQAIALSVTGAAGLACGQAASLEQTDPYRGLKVGMHSYTLRKLPFAQALAVTREAGVRYIGFKDIHIPLNSSPEQLAKAKRAVRDAGLTTMACGVVGFKGDAAQARTVFEYAQALGMPTIVANPTRESLKLLDDLVEEFGIRIAIV